MLGPPHRRARAEAAACNVMLSRPGLAVLRARRRRPLIVVGDSHIEPLMPVRRQLRGSSVRVVAVPGATASGIANPNSKAQALPIFERALRRVGPGTTVLSCLGEIDAGFLVFLRASADGGTVEQFTDLAFDRYAAFLTGRVTDRGAALIVLGATMPTVESYENWEGLGGARRTVAASWAERAAMTRYWNDKCAAWCKDSGADWIDLTPHTTDAAGRLLDGFRNPNIHDHHLEPRAHGALLAELLTERGF